MSKAWYEFRDGVREVRWIWPFSVYLLVLVSLVLLVQSIIVRRPQTLPGLIPLLFSAISGLISYWLARSHFKSIDGSIAKPPGEHLLKFSHFFYSKQTLDHTFVPLVADWRHEYFEASAKNKTWKARWISARYMWAAVSTIFLSSLIALKKQTQSARKKV